MWQSISAPAGTLAKTDEALLYLNLRLALDSLPQRQHWLRQTESYPLRTALARLQRLHSGIAGSLLRLLGLPSQHCQDWPVVSQALVRIPPWLESHYRHLRMRPLSMPAVDSQTFRLALWQLEQQMAQWHRHSIDCCRSPAVALLLADMAAARQMSLDGVFPRGSICESTC